MRAANEVEKWTNIVVNVFGGCCPCVHGFVCRARAGFNPGGAGEGLQSSWEVWGSLEDKEWNRQMQDAVLLRSLCLPKGILAPCAALAAAAAPALLSAIPREAELRLWLCSQGRFWDNPQLPPSLTPDPRNLGSPSGCCSPPAPLLPPPCHKAKTIFFFRNRVFFFPSKTWKELPQRCSLSSSSRALHWLRPWLCRQLLRDHPRGAMGH